MASPDKNTSMQSLTFVVTVRIGSTFDAGMSGHSIPPPISLGESMLDPVNFTTPTKKPSAREIRKMHDTERKQMRDKRKDDKKNELISHTPDKPKHPIFSLTLSKEGSSKKVTDHSKMVGVTFTEGVLSLDLTSILY